MRTRILLIFALSGAAGLIDEIVWSRQLVLVFGNTTQAVSAILTGFFAGMAIGAPIGGRLADRVRSPLRLYGLLEVVLAAVVIATPLTFRLINEIYRGIYPGLEGSPQALALVRMGLAILALAPATILMGATLPSLTRYLTREGHLSAAFGKLYSANIMGAVVGTLVAGFVLIELLGLTGALAVGAACSAIAGVSALTLDRRHPAPAPAPAPTLDRTTVASSAVSPPVATTVSPSTSIGRGRVGLALTVAFVSGLTSLGYQVLWTRMLASGTGNTTYVFTVILALFLIGLAIGALLFNIIRPRLHDPARLLAAAQVLIGVLVLFGLVVVIAHPSIVDEGNPYSVLGSLFGTAILVVLLTTVVLGLTFPAASAMLADDPSTSGRSTGTFLAVNTVGSIAGSFLVPFLLIPWLGSPHAAALLAILNVGVGAAIAIVSPSASGKIRWATPVVAGVVVITIVAVSFAPGVLVSPNEARLHARGATIFGVSEDEIATVESGQLRPTPELWVAGTSMTLLTVDANLMPILPLIARPDSKRALIVAFGMGTAYRTALIAGLKTDVVELVPSVPKMFHFYHPDADAVFANPQGHVIIADGRNHLELTNDRFDIIVTDPPPPLESSGASVISSREYYEAGKAHLNPGGVMMQWIPYGQTINEYRAHLRAFNAVFPEVTIAFGAGGYGNYLLGSDDPIAFEPDAIRSVLARPGVLEDISSEFDSPTDTIDGWIAQIKQMTWISGDRVTKFAGEGPQVTDDRPLSEYFMIRRFMGDGTGPATPTALRAAESSGD
jgi:spermidine synthase